MGGQPQVSAEISAPVKEGEKSQGAEYVNAFSYLRSLVFKPFKQPIEDIIPTLERLCKVPPGSSFKTGQLAGIECMQRSDECGQERLE